MFVALDVSALQSGKNKTVIGITPLDSEYTTSEGIDSDL